MLIYSLERLAAAYACVRDEPSHLQPWEEEEVEEAFLAVRV